MFHFKSCSDNVGFNDLCLIYQFVCHLRLYSTHLCSHYTSFYSVYLYSIFTLMFRIMVFGPCSSSFLFCNFCFIFLIFCLVTCSSDRAFPAADSGRVYLFTSASTLPVFFSRLKTYLFQFSFPTNQTPALWCFSSLSKTLGHSKEHLCLYAVDQVVSADNDRNQIFVRKCEKGAKGQDFPYTSHENQIKSNQARLILTPTLSLNAPQCEVYNTV